MSLLLAARSIRTVLYFFREKSRKHYNISNSLLLCLFTFQTMARSINIRARGPKNLVFILSSIKMSRKGRETTEQERKQIISLHNQCKSLSQISSIVGRPRSTIQSIIDRFGLRKTVKNAHRSGRPRILSDTDERFIVRTIKKDPTTSASTIATAMHNRGIQISVSSIRKILSENDYHGRVGRQKPWVNKVNRTKRLVFAKTYINKDQTFWDRVIWSDESKFTIFGSGTKRIVWRKQNEELNPKNLIPTVKHGAGSVMVWGCMSSAGVGKLHVIEGTMTHKVYIKILEENLAASAEKFGLQGRYVFQQDNDPKHTAYNTKQWLLYNVPEQLHTPPQSPDLNPIEHLWSILKNKVRQRQVSSRADLIKVLKEEWEAISPSITKNLVNSVPRRLRAVIESKGYPTKY